MLRELRFLGSYARMTEEPQFFPRYKESQVFFLATIRHAVSPTFRPGT